METVTSISGGKTSAMMALEFPTDHYIFAVVLTDHKPSAPKDKGLLREVNVIGTSGKPNAFNFCRVDRRDP